MKSLPRVWDKVEKEMMSPAKWEENYVGCDHKKIGLYIYRSRKGLRQHSSLDWVIKHPESFDVMWPTGLKDKNGLTEVYEGDIIGVDGLIKGNQHESPNLLQEKTNFVVPAITSKAWEKAYKKAMVRGCKHAK